MASTPSMGAGTLGAWGAMTSLVRSGLYGASGGEVTVSGAREVRTVSLEGGSRVEV